MLQPSRLPGFAKDPVICSLPHTVQVYVVGGAVRDLLMGRAIHDRDWVVVGASAKDMLNTGFTPVGADFPVFLHPHTKEEYALARTERKLGHGYKGFVVHADPSVRLEDDLLRRDFTINAMAMSSDGTLIDPHGGQADLGLKTLRHVGPAFSEDPLRVLRLARFLARFVDFEVHPDTLSLCRELQASGELSYLVPERIYAELNRGLTEPKPSRMVAFIGAISAWAQLVKPMSVPYGQFSEADLMLLDALSDAEQRWAFLLGYKLPAGDVRAVGDALRVPRDMQDLAWVLGQCKQFFEWVHPPVSAHLDFFAAVDVYRKPERLQKALLCIQNMGASHPSIEMLSRGVDQQLQGHYKEGLRAHLSAVNAKGSEMAAAVSAFRHLWVQALLA